LWHELVQPHQSVALRAFIAGSVAAGATAVGTLPILFARTISARVRDVLLGFGAGVMLAASAFSLVIPALNSAAALGFGPWASGLTVAAGMLLGALLLLGLDRYVPHEHFIKGAEGSLVRARALRRTWLFVFAIALHNLPEGLAIGVAYAGPDPAGAAALATGISIQDFPEGLVIALALLTAGYRRGFSILLGAVSGLVEPVAAAGGAAIISASALLLPWGLAMAAGAMLFVISHEIIPESHRQGHEREATIGLMFGFVLMMVLDTALS
jgi:ZIP family zinc transporter